MNERIQIFKQETKIINGRRQEPSSSLFYKCWAEVLDLYGQELYEAMAIKLKNTVVFKVRYCKKLEELRNKDDFIIEWKNRKYKIYYPDFLNYNKQFVKLKCMEVI